MAHVSRRRRNHVPEGRWAKIGAIAGVAAVALTPLSVDTKPDDIQAAPEALTSQTSTTPPLPTTAPATTISTTPPAPTFPIEAPPTSTTTAAPPPPSPTTKGHVRWSGQLTVGYVHGGLKDLDKVPPVTVAHDGHGDVSFNSAGSTGNTLLGVDGALIAEWTEDASGPAYQQCQDVAQKGTGEHALQARDILCVLTNEGRTAVMSTRNLCEPAKTGCLPTFQTTVWEE